MDHTFRVEQDARNEMHIPNLKYAGGHYRIRAEVDGSVEIFGDRQGLLYLAEIIAGCALGDLSAGFHVHLPRLGVASEPDTSGDVELTVYSASTPVPG